MARDFNVSKLPDHRSLFSPDERVYQILCKESDIKDLNIVLRSVLSKIHLGLIDSYEQDVLCDLYNSISLIRFK